MNRVKVLDKEFELYVSEVDILRSIGEISKKINENYRNRIPIFIGVLNGCFFFATELIKRIDLECEVAFLKFASYEGIKSTGVVKQLIGLDIEVEGRDVIVMEDIVDSGNTIEEVRALLIKKKPKSIAIATLLYKPKTYKKPITIDYIGLEIDSYFVVGCGLDYSGLGRNLKNLYKLSN